MKARTKIPQTPQAHLDALISTLGNINTRQGITNLLTLILLACKLTLDAESVPGPGAQPEPAPQRSAGFPAKPRNRCPKKAAAKPPKRGRLSQSKTARAQFAAAQPSTLKAITPEDLAWHLGRYPEDRALMQNTPLPL